MRSSARAVRRSPKGTHPRARSPRGRSSARGRTNDSTSLGEALRASREALTDVQRQLDALLAAVRAPAGRPAPDAADRLGRAANRASAAVERLAEI